MNLRPEMIVKVVDRLRAMADESRIRLLLRLRRSPANVSTLVGELGIAQASVSKHLSILRQAGLVEARRQGTQAIYAVRDPSVFELCRIVCGSVTRFIEEEHAAIRPPSRRSGKEVASL